MSDCTRAMRPKAMSASPCSTCSGRSSEMAISTKVPRCGRQRLMLESDFIGVEQSAHCIRHVHTGERGAGKVLDVLVDLHRLRGGLAGELGAPFRIPHSSTI